jgi:hypothetical protein
MGMPIIGYHVWGHVYGHDKTFKNEQECIGHKSILQNTIKRTHIINHIWWEKN